MKPDCPVCGAKDMGCVVGRRGSGLSITHLPKEAPSMYTSDRRLYLNADKTAIVPEHSPEAAFLLVSASGQISDEEARKYGLVTQIEALPAPEEEPKTEPEVKMQPGPPENKARSRRGAEDK